MTGAIEAVIFDCDGVLVDSEVLALEIEIKALGEIGLVYDEDVYKARFLGLSMEAYFAAVEADHRARCGRDLPAGFRENHGARYQGEMHRLREVPGANAALCALRHVKAVASSSGAAALARKLELTGLTAHFAPHIYSADHVVRAKPAPDLFLHAATALGVAPERCLALEDSANGVRAARAAGMQVWGFLGGAHMGEAAGERLLQAGAARLVRNWREAGVSFARLV